MLINQDLRAPKTLEELFSPELLAKLDRLSILSRKLFAGKMPGERRSKRRGQSVEFDDYRPYSRGDDLRHLDWNVYARFDRFVLKLFREEEDQTLHLYLDASASMLAGGGSAGGLIGSQAGTTKLIAAGRLTLALASIGLMQQNRVVVTVLGVPPKSSKDYGIERSAARGSRTLAPVRGRRHITRVGEFLLEAIQEAVRTLPQVDLQSELRRSALTRQGQGVAILLSDLFLDDGLEDALTALSGSRGYDAACLQIIAPSELDPTLERERGLVGDLRLTDIETGVASEATISKALIERYQEKFAAHQQRCIRACLAREIVHVLVRSDADAAEVLLRTLRERRVLG